MQNVELTCIFILHSAFCILDMRDDTLTRIDDLKTRLTSVRSYL